MQAQGDVKIAEADAFAESASAGKANATAG